MVRKDNFCTCFIHIKNKIKQSYLWSLVGTIIVLFFLTVVATILIPGFCSFFTNGGNEIDAWLYLLTASGTIILAYIAWVKISKIETETLGNFLLHINERWSAQEILKARTIIHQFYLKSKKELSGDSILSIEQEKDLHSRIGKKICDLGQDPNRADDFIHLLNFLELMDSIGYLVSNEHVKTDRLEASHGLSIIFNYEIFKEYIEMKRKRHGNCEFYKDFEELYKSLKN